LFDHLVGTGGKRGHSDSTAILPWLFRRAPLGGMIATEVAPAPISGRVESDRHHV
jgi:hypothetical protein